MIINTNNLVNLTTDKLEVKYVDVISGQTVKCLFENELSVDSTVSNFYFSGPYGSKIVAGSGAKVEDGVGKIILLSSTGSHSISERLYFPKAEKGSKLELSYETTIGENDERKWMGFVVMDSNRGHVNLGSGIYSPNLSPGIVFYHGHFMGNNNEYYIYNYSEEIKISNVDYLNGKTIIETKLIIDLINKTVEYSLIEKDTKKEIANGFYNIAEEIFQTIEKIDCIEFHTKQYDSSSNIVTAAVATIDNLSVTITEELKENILYIIPDNESGTGKLYIYNGKKLILIGDNSSIVDKYVASATFDSINSKIILIFTDESTIEIPLGDLKVDMSNIQTKKLTVTSSKSTDNTLIEPLKVRDDRIDIFKTTNDYGTDSQYAGSNVVIKKDESIKIDNIKLELTDAAVLDAHKVLTDDGDDGGLQVGNTLKIQDGMIKLGYNANDDSYNSYIEGGQKDDNNDSVQELIIATKNNKQGVRISDNNKMVSIFANQIKLAYNGSHNENSNAAIDTSASDVSNGIKLRARENNSKGGRNNLVVEQNEVRICGDINLKDVSTNCVQLPDDVTEEEIAYLEGSLQNTLINLKRDMTNLLNTIKGLETKVAALENATT